MRFISSPSLNLRSFILSTKKIVLLFLLPQTTVVPQHPISFTIQATKTSELTASTVKILTHQADFLEQFRADISWEHPVDCNDEENRCTLFNRVEIRRQVLYMSYGIPRQDGMKFK